MKARGVVKGLAGAVGLLLVFPLAAYADNVKPDGDLTFDGEDIVLEGCVLPSAEVAGHVAVKRTANDKSHFSPGEVLTATYSASSEQIKVSGEGSVTVPDGYSANGKRTEFYIPITTQVLAGAEQGSGSVKVTLASAGGYSESGSYNVSWECAGVKDTTPPVLILPEDITVEATSSAGANVDFEVSATDDVTENPTVECSAESGDLFPLGTTTVNCTAEDEAGNEATGSFKVTVVVGWGGFLQPLNPGGPATFKLNSTIPVKFQLAGASAGITDLDARLFVRPVGGGAEFAATSTSGATTGNAFRWDADGGHYIFNLSTRAIGSAGSYELRVELGDGVPHTIEVQIRK